MGSPAGECSHTHVTRAILRFLFPRSLYEVTKAALEALTRVWADELGRAEATIRTTLNTVCVGLTKPLEASGSSTKRTLSAMEAQSALVDVRPRANETQEVAEVFGFLVSEQAGWITGSVIAANGGFGPPRS